MTGRLSGVEALSLYHDLWDLKLRAEQKNCTFLAYLLQVALQDLEGALTAGDRASATVDRAGATVDRASATVDRASAE